MKTRLILIFITCVSLQGFSQARLNKLSVNPIQLFGSNITNMEYERGFNEGKLGVAFYYGMTGIAPGSTGNYYSIRISEQNVSIKGYSKSIDSNSFWYGGQLSVSSADIWGNSARASYAGALGLSGILGYQWIIKSFYLGVYGGLGYALTDSLFGDAFYRGDLSEKKLLLTFGIKTGIAF